MVGRTCTRKQRGRVGAVLYCAHVSAFPPDSFLLWWVLSCAARLCLQLPLTACFCGGCSLGLRCLAFHSLLGCALLLATDITSCRWPITQASPGYGLPSWPLSLEFFTCFCSRFLGCAPGIRGDVLLISPVMVSSSEALTSGTFFIASIRVARGCSTVRKQARKSQGTAKSQRSVAPLGRP